MDYDEDEEDDENPLAGLELFKKFMQQTYGKKDEFGMREATREEASEFRRIEGLKPGDSVRRVRDDGKIWPEMNEVVRVYQVFDPPVILTKQEENGRRVTYDFSVLTCSKKEEDFFVEFVFDSRYFRKTIVQEEEEKD